MDQVEILGLNSKFELGEHTLPEDYKNFNVTGFAGFPFSDVKPEKEVRRGRALVPAPVGLRLND